MIDLLCFPSDCEPRAPVIVSRDRGQKRTHRAINIELDLVRHYRIDGKVICALTEKKCDFLLLDDTKQTAYLIELKGCHLMEAVEQLKNTARLLEGCLHGYSVNYRIVYRSNTHAVRSSEYDRFRRAVSGRLIAQTTEIEEKI